MPYFNKKSITTSTFLRKSYNWLLPNFCLFCKQPVGDKSLCEACCQNLPWQSYACRQCGQTLTTSNVDIRCGECLKNPPVYDSTICLFHYANPIDTLILALKFGGNLIYAKLLGELMQEKIEAWYKHHDKPDCIIPIPLHRKRLQERGFNQALEIIKPVAKRMNISLELDLCKRKLNTAAQSSAASAAVRKRNIKNAFWISPAFQANHVAVVDDVITTGQTVAEFSRLLKKAGVRQIDVWCCARTTLHEPNV